ncbi:MAG TPA: GntR family transcriptional regulator [Trebonia sp.]|nr:GntR family transcriptional regulator [Trebonia sp.]
MANFDSTRAQYDRLRSEILDGAFDPGAVLLETALSARYGVSRTPVREALARLAQDGLIERSARGFRIPKRDPEEIVGIYEARIALETRSAELAAARRTDFDLARMTHLLDERKTATDPERSGPLNARWHDAMRVAAHSETITGLLARVDSLLLLYRPRVVTPAPRDDSLEEHARILDAIARGDAATAGTVMADHLGHMRDWRIKSLLADGQ